MWLMNLLISNGFLLKRTLARPKEMLLRPQELRDLLTLTFNAFAY